MGTVRFATELGRLLRSGPYGSTSALARFLGVEPASVSAWKVGKSSPEEHRWAALEEFLGLPAGHLAALLNPGEIDRVEATWPLLRAGSGSSRPPTADLEDALALARKMSVLDPSSADRALDVVNALQDLNERRRSLGWPPLDDSPIHLQMDNPDHRYLEKVHKLRLAALSGERRALAETDREFDALLSLSDDYEIHPVHAEVLQAHLRIERAVQSADEITEQVSALRAAVQLILRERGDLLDQLTDDERAAIEPLLSEDYEPF